MLVKLFTGNVYTDISPLAQGGLAGAYDTVGVIVQVDITSDSILTIIYDIVLDERCTLEQQLGVGITSTHGNGTPNLCHVVGDPAAANGDLLAVGHEDARA